MSKSITALFAVVMMLTLSACTSQDIYQTSNDIWCVYQDNTNYALEDELYPGEKRNTLNQVKKCEYMSYERYRDHTKELDDTIAKHKRKHGL